jgi:hypothetical protein
VSLPPLATVADVQLLHGPFEDQELDKVARLLDMASGAVRRYCRQTLSFVPDDQVALLSNGTTFLELAERPVVAVLEVEVLTTWAEGAWPEGAFTWDSAGQMHRVDGLTWGHRYDVVMVTYSHGFDPVPADLSGLVAAKVAQTLAGNEANPGGLRSLQTGAMSETYSNAAGNVASLGAAALTEDERDYLRAAGYRRTANSVAAGMR